MEDIEFDSDFLPPLRDRGVGGSHRSAWNGGSCEIGDRSSNAFSSLSGSRGGARADGGLVGEASPVLIDTPPLPATTALGQNVEKYKGVIIGVVIFAVIIISVIIGVKVHENKKRSKLDGEDEDSDDEEGDGNNGQPREDYSDDDEGSQDEEESDDDNPSSSSTTKKTSGSSKKRPFALPSLVPSRSSLKKGSNGKRGKKAGGKTGNKQKKHVTFADNARGPTAVPGALPAYIKGGSPCERCGMKGGGCQCANPPIGGALLKNPTVQIKDNLTYVGPPNYPPNQSIPGPYGPAGPWGPMGSPPGDPQQLHPRGKYAPYPPDQPVPTPGNPYAQMNPGPVHPNHPSDPVAPDYVPIHYPGTVWPGNVPPGKHYPQNYNPDGQSANNAYAQYKGQGNYGDMNIDGQKVGLASLHDRFQEARQNRGNYLQTPGGTTSNIDHIFNSFDTTNLSGGNHGTDASGGGGEAPSSLDEAFKSDDDRPAPQPAMPRQPPLHPHQAQLPPPHGHHPMPSPPPPDYVPGARNGGPMAPGAYSNHFGAEREPTRKQTHPYHN